MFDIADNALFVKCAHSTKC